MLAQWRLARAGVANAAIQYSQQLWLAHLQTALVLSMLFPDVWKLC
jgi:hypothetical protein